MVTDVTVLGAGNTGFAVAANLTLAGHSVTLGELPAFPEAIAPVRDDRTIELLGVAHTGAARKLPTSPTTWLRPRRPRTRCWSSCPAYGHAPWARGIGPTPARRPHPDPDARHPGSAGSCAHPA